MTLPALLLLALIAAGLAWKGWRRSAWALFAAVLALTLAIGCGPATQWLLRDLQAGYTGDTSTGQGARTAIILLGGGTERAGDGAVETVPLAYGRLVKALDLYLACKQQGGECFILASGGDPRRHGVSEAAVYGAQLARLGVPPADVVLEERSLNTWQNAQFCAQLLRQHPADAVVLVTSGMHLRRSQLYFGHFGVHGSPVRADYVNATMSLVPLAYNFLLADLAMHEHEGIVRYHLYQALGWNVTAGAPGAL
jgi:uncharacterized SAM-binding protein YcdF (DUF218 family)